MYTMINERLETYLKKKCEEIKVTAHPILDNTILKLKESFEIKTKNEQKPGEQHKLSEDYFDRIEALQYAIANDDGQSSDKFKADVILFGVSRTSKTPTAIYLANKGIKVANIPFVLSVVPLKRPASVIAAVPDALLVKVLSSTTFPFVAPEELVTPIFPEPS